MCITFPPFCTQITKPLEETHTHTSNALTINHHAQAGMWSLLNAELLLTLFFFMASPSLSNATRPSSWKIINCRHASQDLNSSVLFISHLQSVLDLSPFPRSSILFPCKIFDWLFSSSSFFFSLPYLLFHLDDAICCRRDTEKTKGIKKNCEACVKTSGWSKPRMF